MDVRKLIPKHKDDQDAIRRLKDLSFEQLRPIVPDLLECLQDLHWPIARPVADILKPYAENIVTDIIKIFRSNDGMWKFGILTTLGRGNSDTMFLAEIKRIAQFPTTDEIAEDVYIEAIAILNGDYE